MSPEEKLSLSSEETESLEDFDYMEDCCEQEEAETAETEKEPAEKPRGAKACMLKLIRFYQRHISPMKKAPCCKYIPSCSRYAIEAIERFGAFKGTCLAVWRVLRCNPFSKGGFDPVPEKKK